MSLDSSTRFEIMALAFRKMTRCWPPCKDWPAALEHRTAWNTWRHKYGSVASAIFDAIDELRSEGMEI